MHAHIMHKHTHHAYIYYIERSGSGVELQTLDYENPGSNPVWQCINLGQVFSLYIAPIHSAVQMSTWL